MRIWNIFMEKIETYWAKNETMSLKDKWNEKCLTVSILMSLDVILKKNLCVNDVYANLL